MHQTRKGNQWYFGMKAHIGVDEFYGLVHHVKCAAASVGDVMVTHELLHGKEDCMGGQRLCRGRLAAGASGSQSCPLHRQETRPSEGDQERARPSAARALGERQSEHTREGGASVPSGQAPVWLHQVRYRGPAKNSAQVLTLFALSNLWMTRRQLVPMQG